MEKKNILFRIQELQKLSFWKYRFVVVPCWLVGYLRKQRAGAKLGSLYFLNQNFVQFVSIIKQNTQLKGCYAIYILLTYEEVAYFD